MKKIAFIGFMLLSIAASAYGQKGKVNTAYNLVVISPPDFEGAKDNIDAALKDPSTKDWVRTWYTAGFVYDKILEDQIKKGFAKNDDKEVRGESTVKAYDYYVKAYDLDQLPNEKGKVAPKYSKSIASSMRLYPAELFTYGVEKYGAGEYPEAVDVWKRYLEMPGLPMFSAEKAKMESDSMYLATAYYAASAAMTVFNTEKAEKLENDSMYLTTADYKALEKKYTDFSIKYFEKIKDKYEVTRSYQLLAQQYIDIKKDTTNYLRIVKEGFNKYSDNPYFLGSLIDYYIYFEGNVDSAFYYVNEAIKKNPNEADNYFIRGAIYETRDQNDEALLDFKKTLSINPTHERAMYAIGSQLIKKGDAQMSIADRTKDPRVEKAEKDKAMELYKEATVYLEKVRSLNSENRNNLILLRSAYYKIYRDDRNSKYIEIDNAIKAL